MQVMQEIGIGTRVRITSSDCIGYPGLGTVVGLPGWSDDVSYPTVTPESLYVIKPDGAQLSYHYSPLYFEMVPTSICAECDKHIYVNDYLCEECRPS